MKRSYDSCGTGWPEPALWRRILPAVYSFVGTTWDATPSQLGALTLCRALVQALSSPIGGFLGRPLLPLLVLGSSQHHTTTCAGGWAFTKPVCLNGTGHFYDRIRVTAAGCLLWACMTSLFGSAKTLQHGMAAWAINGLGLAMVRPLEHAALTAVH